MSSVNNQLEQTFQKYLDTTDWAAFDDHHDTAEYIPELLLQLAAGMDEEEETQLLGELFSRVYYQESLSTAIQVITYPLLLLCIMDKIKSRSIVLEFVLEIEQRYLFLKGHIGVMPYKYAYLGEFYNGEQAVAEAIEKGEQPYYHNICQQREWLTALFADKDVLVQNLAIKAYGLTAYNAGSAEPEWQAAPLTEQLYKENTVANTIITLGMAAQLSGQKLSLPDDITSNSSYYPYIAISKALAGNVDQTTLQGLMQDSTPPEANYTFLPWFDGSIQLLTLAALAENSDNNPAISDYIVEQVKQLKKKPTDIPGQQWKRHEVAAEFIAAATFHSLVPSGHKRNSSELVPAQLELFKKLSAQQKIITATQVIAGLPGTIKEANIFVGLSAGASA